jgi:hypothetical protein
MKEIVSIDKRKTDAIKIISSTARVPLLLLSL